MSQPTRKENGQSITKRNRINNAGNATKHTCRPALICLLINMTSYNKEINPLVGHRLIQMLKRTVGIVNEIET
jgi:hypothetical protein